MNKTKICLFTNDVETTSIWHNCLHDEMGEKLLKDGMPILLELYKKKKIRTTFFFTAYIAEKFPELVKMILPYGHEVGCHGLTHEVNNAFDVLSLKEQIKQLDKAKKILEKISGEEIISFRAPALRVNKYTSQALEKIGFLIDSSVASQRADMFFSFGAIKKLKWLIAPRLPYNTDKNNLFKSGNSKILEIPISAIFLPYIGTFLRISPFVTAILRNLLNVESIFRPKPIVFLIHPNEFIDETNEPIKFIKRTNNFISYVLADLFRHKLKVNNLGLKALYLYEKQLDYFIKRGYKFITLKEYYYKMNQTNLNSK